MTQHVMYLKLYLSLLSLNYEKSQRHVKAKCRLYQVIALLKLLQTFLVF